MMMITRTVTAALLATAAVVGAPSAVAVPGDPMAGCETQIFANYCDGPIREDGSWRRCLFAHGSFTGGYDGMPGSYIPPVQNCFIVPNENEIPPLPLGQPGHHID